ncbi:hypothetical protein IWX49DRAFT_603041 [Phyllosticta citricarpa]|uniref:Zn(2)-C6 fungal-type domain-containing protein n=2 Tax=Phyllosticta TaxID=121621 RepID=A0ABR1L2H7_9PEZI
MDSTPSPSTKRSRKRACDQCNAKHYRCIPQRSSDDDVRIPCARCYDRSLPCSITPSRPDPSTPCPSPRRNHDDEDFDVDAFLQTLSPTDEPLPLVPPELVLSSQDVQDGGSGMIEGHDASQDSQNGDMLLQPSRDSQGGMIESSQPTSSDTMSEAPTTSADLDLLQPETYDWFPTDMPGPSPPEQAYDMYFQPSFQVNLLPFSSYNSQPSFQYHLSPGVATSFTVTVTTNGNCNGNNSNFYHFPNNFNFDQGNHYPTF